MRISLGTAQFGLDYGISNKSGKIEPKEVDKILSFAKNGIKSIDTASKHMAKAKLCLENMISMILKLYQNPRNSGTKH